MLIRYLAVIHWMIASAMKDLTHILNLIPMVCK